MWPLEKNFPQDKGQLHRVYFLLIAGSVAPRHASDGSWHCRSCVVDLRKSLRSSVEPLNLRCVTLCSLSSLFRRVFAGITLSVATANGQSPTPTPYSGNWVYNAHP